MKQNSTSKVADLIIRNARIWTANPVQPFAQSMAVTGDKILAVGTNQSVTPYQGAETRIMDVSGKLILPGFIDSHVHFLHGGFSLSGVQLKDCRTREEFIRRIGSFSRQMNPGEWMLQGYWDHQNWGGVLPEAGWIDEVTGDIPVFLSRSDMHMALANTAAMKLAGIQADTPQPDGGEIVRGADGNPSGIFKDNAMQLITRYIPPYSAQQYSKAVEAAMDYLASNGVTSVHHMGTLEDYDIFRKHLQTKGLRTRIYCTAPLWEYPEILRKKRETENEPVWLRLNGAKIFSDGSLGSKTAAFFEPYLESGGQAGLLMDDPKKMQQGVLEADKAGLQVVIHAIGDRANNIVLNFYEHCLQENGDRDRRFRIEHVQHLHPADIQRFAELKVIASMQPWHLMDDGQWCDQILGEERSRYAYCFRSLLDANATLAFGSDWSVAPPIPLEGIYAALTRRVLDNSKPEGWTPSEKISLEEALQSYTIHAAYAAFEEDIKGSLEEGKLADFVILEKDIFEIQPEEIAQVSILATFVGGIEVFRKQ